MNHFKDFDNKTNISIKITKDYGLPMWDLSISLKNYRGALTLFTPIVNESDSVTGLIISAEVTKKFTKFYVLDKKIAQSKLKTIGDKNATLFTKSTLNGIYNALQKRVIDVKMYKENQLSNGKISSNSLNTNALNTISVTTCWTYIAAVDDNYNTLIMYQCSSTTYWIDFGTTNTTESPYLNPISSGTGGLSPSSTISSLNISDYKAVISPAPIKVYSNICDAINEMWNSYPNNETFGYLTEDGKVIFTNILPLSGGQAAGLYNNENSNDYYFVYPKSAGTYSFINPISNSTNTFVKVIASIHTHTPCRFDGTDGVTNKIVSLEDASLANQHPGLINYVIGCGAIANFNESNDSYFNIHNSSQSNLCQYVLN